VVENPARLLTPKMSENVKNVGILGIEIHFPNQYVDQNELEEFDQVSKGKYTIGLGQLKMGFCSDREDINSICLTAVQKLMEKMNLGYERIGRLEVGTETIIDKSKSVKSVLMQLFKSSGNTDVEGVDTTNACYGGTSALLNAVSWVQSHTWDGRLALVVAGDIAVYASGNARPTGGAGAIAMLVGPNAPIVFDKVRATHMAHVYDFYKPDLSSEYPYVDGKLSIECYLSALDKCYQLYCAKEAKLGHKVSLDHFDYFCFHSPFCKLVQKSFARLYLNDFFQQEEDSSNYSDLHKFRDLKLEDTYFNRELEQIVMTSSKPLFLSKTQTTLTLSTLIGNMYTSSLYGGLISLLVSKDATSLLGKRIGMFSYGSGLASTMFSLQVSNEIEAVEPLVHGIKDVAHRLDSRKCVAPAEFSAVLKSKEETHHLAPYQPTGPIDTLDPGVYYLVDIDSMYRRSYARRPIDGLTNGSK